MSHQAGQQLFSSEALIPSHVGLPGSPGQSMNIDSYRELLFSHLISAARRNILAPAGKILE
jgi:hypothetical protein